MELIEIAALGGRQTAMPRKLRPLDHGHGAVDYHRSVRALDSVFRLYGALRTRFIGTALFVVLAVNFDARAVALSRSRSGIHRPPARNQIFASLNPISDSISAAFVE